MTDETFATVRRGYDPAQVDSVLRRMRQTHAAALQEAATQTVEINKLNQALEASQGRVTGLQQQVSELQEQVTQAQSHASNGHGTDFTSLGERIAQMLTLAQEEADDIRLRTATVVLALGCVVLAATVPYARARAESIGATASVGIAERTDRLVIALVATFAVGLGAPQWVLSVALGYVALASAITVVQRITAVRRQTVDRQTSRASGTASGTTA